MLDSKPQVNSRGVRALLVAGLGVVIAPTVAEFLVALVNRYRTYPVGADTDMLAHTTILQILIVSAAFIPSVFVVKSRKFLLVLSVFVLLFLVLASLSIPSFLPEDWCKHELRIYSCESGARYQH
jgi:hypothetical protein